MQAHEAHFSEQTIFGTDEVFTFKFTDSQVSISVKEQVVYNDSIHFSSFH